MRRSRKCGFVVSGNVLRCGPVAQWPDGYEFVAADNNSATMAPSMRHVIVIEP
jgi:hypothetical protein